MDCFFVFLTLPFELLDGLLLVQLVDIVARAFGNVVLGQSHDPLEVIGDFLEFIVFFLADFLGLFRKDLVYLVLELLHVEGVVLDHQLVQLLLLH